MNAIAATQSKIAITKDRGRTRQSVDDRYTVGRTADIVRNFVAINRSIADVLKHQTSRQVAADRTVGQRPQATSNINPVAGVLSRTHLVHRQDFGSRFDAYAFLRIQFGAKFAHVQSGADVSNPKPLGAAGELEIVESHLIGVVQLKYRTREKRIGETQLCVVIERSVHSETFIVANSEHIGNDEWIKQRIAAGVDAERLIGTYAVDSQYVIRIRLRCRSDFAGVAIASWYRHELVVDRRSIVDEEGIRVLGNRERLGASIENGKVIRE